jgi:nucleotide-binding universal stress UspA family protein
MKQPSRILVAVDGSEASMNASDYAITLAQNNNNQEAKKIFILNVIDIPSLFKMLPSDTRKQLTRIGRQQANQIFDAVDEIAKRHNATNVKVIKKIIETTSASPVDEIIKYAKEKGVNLIIVGTKGRSGMKKALLGSVASKVVTYAPCSVLVVR